MCGSGGGSGGMNRSSASSVSSSSRSAPNASKLSSTVGSAGWSVRGRVCWVGSLRAGGGRGGGGGGRGRGRQVLRGGPRRGGRVDRGVETGHDLRPLGFDVRLAGRV